MAAADIWTKDLPDDLARLAEHLVSIDYQPIPALVMAVKTLDRWADSGNERAATALSEFQAIKRPEERVIAEALKRIRRKEGMIATPDELRPLVAKAAHRAVIAEGLLVGLSDGLAGQSVASARALLEGGKATLTIGKVPDPEPEEVAEVSARLQAEIEFGQFLMDATGYHEAGAKARDPRRGRVAVDGARPGSAGQGTARRGEAALQEHKLTKAEREALPSSAFVFKDRPKGEPGSYPIHDEEHARAALAFSKGTKDEARVRAAVRARYPSMRHKLLEAVEDTSADMEARQDPKAAKAAAKQRGGGTPKEKAAAKKGRGREDAKNPDFEQMHPRGRAGVWIKKGDGMGAQPMVEVQQLQTRLAQLGFGPGQADGRFGPLTEQAVVAFQSKYGLPITGSISAADVEMMRNPVPPKGEVKKAEAKTGETKAAASSESRPDTFDPKDADSIRAFQRAHGLTVDGIAGPETNGALRALESQKASEREGVDNSNRSGETASERSKRLTKENRAAADKSGTPKKGAASVLKRGEGMEGKPSKPVRQFQEILADLGFDLGEAGVDGRFGPDTQKAVKALQEKYGLKVDGIVGERTKKLLTRLAERQKKRYSNENPALKEHAMWNGTGLTFVKVEEAFRAPFDPRLHPRDRMGRWRDALARLVSAGGKADPGSMTRMHFQEVANALASYDAPIEEKTALAEHFANALRGSNPYFDRARFTDAATGEGEGYGATSMRRGQYQVIADAIATAPTSDRHRLADHFAGRLRHTNASFNTGRFMRAAVPDEGTADAPQGRITYTEGHTRTGAPFAIRSYENGRGAQVSINGEVIGSIDDTSDGPNSPMLFSRRYPPQGSMDAAVQFVRDQLGAEAAAKLFEAVERRKAAQEAGDTEAFVAARAREVALRAQVAEVGTVEKQGGAWQGKAGTGKAGQGGARLDEAADSLAKASKHKKGLERKPGSQDNWVERSGPGGKHGQLPAYIQHVAIAIRDKRGIPTSRAIGMAIGVIRRWAAGGGNVDAGTRAAAQKAMVEWEAMKLKTKAKKVKRAVTEADVIADLGDPEALLEGATIEATAQEILDGSVVPEVAQVKLPPLHAGAPGGSDDADSKTGAEEDLTAKPISTLAVMIADDWHRVDPGARPYLDAMRGLTPIGREADDRAALVVRGFLANAGSWTGEVATLVKRELARRI